MQKSLQKMIGIAVNQEAVVAKSLFYHSKKYSHENKQINATRIRLFDK